MKRNTLTTAVVAGLTGMAGMVSVSNAVNVNPDGMGQVLLYPYYSARGGNDTLISIVNTTERGKAVKIRFREAINSRDVLDFHIYMSAYDVWTAAVTENEEGGAHLVTNDTTCTVPYLFGDFDGKQDFLDFDYNTEEDEDTNIDGTIDGGPSGIERTASGYVEVIEMGSLVAHPDSEPEEEDEAEYVSWATKHTSDGVPNDCDALVNAWTENAGSKATLGDLWVDEDDSDIGIENATGGLFGSASIINVADGTMFSYNATAIDGFFDKKKAHEAPGLETPSLFSAGNADTSNVFENGQVVSDSWTTAADGDESFGAMLALNAVLTNDKLMNEYITDATSGASTEWVVTFPTKRFHTDPDAGTGVDGDALAPFTQAWSYTEDKTTPACEDVSFTFFDREEQGEETATAAAVPPVVSPAPQVPEAPADLFSICREANVIRFASDDSYPDASEILKEPKRADTSFGYNNFELEYSEGWLTMDLASIPEGSEADGEKRRSSVSDGGDQYEGLPVVGFAVTTYTNGNIGEGVLSNYGGTFQHRTSRSVVVSSD